jgi:hypothetical protein
MVREFRSSAPSRPIPLKSLALGPRTRIVLAFRSHQFPPHTDSIVTPPSSIAPATVFYVLGCRIRGVVCNTVSSHHMPAKADAHLSDSGVKTGEGNVARGLSGIAHAWRIRLFYGTET